MDPIRLADAKAHLSERVARLAAGASTRKRIDAAQLRSLTARMKPEAEGAADLVRAMRDGDRY